MSKIIKMKNDLELLKKELLNLQRDNPRLAVHYTPVYDNKHEKWHIIMHRIGSTSGSDCDDAKQEIVAYKKAISWMKKEIKGYLYELKNGKS